MITMQVRAKQVLFHCYINLKNQSRARLARNSAAKPVTISVSSEPVEPMLAIDALRPGVA